MMEGCYGQKRIISEMAEILTVRVVRCTYDEVLVDQIISVLDGLQVILQASLALLEHALLQLEII